MVGTAYEDVVLTAPVSFGYRRSTTRTTPFYFGRILAALIDRAGLDKDEIDGLAVASYTLFPDSAAALTERFGLCLTWLDDFMIGGTSGVAAVRRAARAVQAGDAEIIACIGADAMGKDSFAGLIANFSTVSRDYAYPYGMAGPNAIFAMLTQNYMRVTGATREDFGRICIAQRQNALDNPQALLRRPLDMAGYLGARPIAEPLHLYDCVMPCAGGDGFLVMGEDRAISLGLPYVTILSTIERHNAFAEDPVQERGGWAIDAEAFYDAAGLGPEDMDFLQAYDDYPVIVMLQLEGLGFCGRGEAPDYVRRTPLTAMEAGLPLNTGGGQLSVGQAGAAGGFLGLVEGIRQLTGEAQGGSVTDARFGIVSGYGMANYRHCVTSGALLLARADA